MIKNGKMCNKKLKKRKKKILKNWSVVKMFKEEICKEHEQTMRNGVLKNSCDCNIILDELGSAISDGEV